MVQGGEKWGQLKERKIRVGREKCQEQNFGIFIMGR